MPSLMDLRVWGIVVFIFIGISTVILRNIPSSIDLRVGVYLAEFNTFSKQSRVCSPCLVLAARGAYCDAVGFPVIGLTGGFP